jgi:hypothetical protein
VCRAGVGRERPVRCVRGHAALMPSCTACGRCPWGPIALVRQRRAIRLLHFGALWLRWDLPDSVPSAAFLSSAGGPAGLPRAIWTFGRFPFLSAFAVVGSGCVVWVVCLVWVSHGPSVACGAFGCTHCRTQGGAYSGRWIAGACRRNTSDRKQTNNQTTRAGVPVAVTLAEGARTALWLRSLLFVALVGAGVEWPSLQDAEAKLAGKVRANPPGPGPSGPSLRAYGTRSGPRIRSRATLGPAESAAEYHG